MSKTLSLCIVSLTVGCASFATDGFDAAYAPSTAPLTAGSWPDFPSERDLALLLPLEEDPLVPASTRLLGGSAALPSSWVDRVGEAFWPTIVEDGFSEDSGALIYCPGQTDSPLSLGLSVSSTGQTRQLENGQSCE